MDPGYKSILIELLDVRLDVHSTRMETSTGNTLIGSVCVGYIMIVRLQIGQWLLAKHIIEVY
jgi:hypothetical protein